MESKCQKIKKNSGTKKSLEERIERVIRMAEMKPEYLKKAEEEAALAEEEGKEEQARMGEDLKSECRTRRSETDGKIRESAKEESEEK